MADVVEQDVLVELKGRRPHKLPEVFVRPALDGKRLPGEVEIHQTGLRYQSPMGSQKIGKLPGDEMHLDRLIMAGQTYYLETSNICSSNRVTRSCS
jgi:hypothetical protein